MKITVKNFVPRGTLVNVSREVYDSILKRLSGLISLKYHLLYEIEDKKNWKNIELMSFYQSKYRKTQKIIDQYLFYLF